MCDETKMMYIKDRMGNEVHAEIPCDNIGVCDTKQDDTGISITHSGTIEWLTYRHQFVIENDAGERYTSIPLPEKLNIHAMRSMRDTFDKMIHALEENPYAIRDPSGMGRSGTIIKHKSDDEK